MLDSSVALGSESSAVHLSLLHLLRAGHPSSTKYCLLHAPLLSRLPVTTSGPSGQESSGCIHLGTDPEPAAHAGCVFASSHVVLSCSICKLMRKAALLHVKGARHSHSAAPPLPASQVAVKQVRHIIELLNVPIKTQNCIRSKQGFARGKVKTVLQLVWLCRHERSSMPTSGRSVRRVCRSSANGAGAEYVEPDGFRIEKVACS